MYFHIIVIICLTISLTCAILAIAFASIAYINVKALEKSTHNIQYVPLDSGWASSDSDITKKLSPHESELPEKDNDELEDNELDLKKMI